MNCSTPGIPVFHYLPEFAQTHVHWVSDAIQPSYPFSILSLPDSLEKTLMLGKIKGFSSELVLCIRWPKCWSFSICPSSEYSRLISFRVDWFDLFAVQGTKESSQAPQFESTDFFFFFLVFSLLYGPTLISVHDYRKHHSFDYTDLCWQSDVSSF